MRLKPDPKLSRNLSLLQSCSQVRIIELTERIASLEKEQLELLKALPELRDLLTAAYQQRQSKEKYQILNPTDKDLLSVSLAQYRNVDPDIISKADLQEYNSTFNKIERMYKNLEEHKELNDLLSQDEVQLRQVNRFLNDRQHSAGFRKFADDVKSHPAVIVGLKYKLRADAVAERNGIADTAYSTKSSKTFSIKDVSLSLDKDFKGRVTNAGIKLAAGLALSATIFSIGLGIGRESIDASQGKAETHYSGTVIPDQPSTESPTITIPETDDEKLNIFTNSVNINSYKSACQDYFEKISDIYRYNTGEEIDLSGYGQENIGYNESTNILVVEYNGQTYRFSGQSQQASNYRHLKEAFDALGVKYTETSSSISYIIDDNDSSQSIAIVDSQGNPVRSGNVITGSNRAYNPDYVRQGRNILEAQGKNASSLSEAECVAAFLLSDKYDTQNPELSVALGKVSNLTYTIKTTFYGESDSYAVYLYSQDSKEFAENFEAKAQEATRIDTQEPSHEDR